MGQSAAACLKSDLAYLSAGVLGCLENVRPQKRRPKTSKTKTSKTKTLKAKTSKTKTSKKTRVSSNFAILTLISYTSTC